MATVSAFRAVLMMGAFAQWGMTFQGLARDDLPVFEQVACGERPEGIPAPLWDSLFTSEDGHWFEFMRVHFDTPHGWDHLLARHGLNATNKKTA